MNYIKWSSYFIFIILLYFNILEQCNMEVISPKFCESDDMEGLIRWYSDVYKFVKSNEDLNKRLTELEGEIKRLNRKFEHQEEHINGEIVIQRRMDGSENFYRVWEDYKHGFGNQSGEFFIGLQRLHKLTNSRRYELWVVMEDFDDVRRYAKYDNFVVASEKENYKLQSLANCAQLYVGAWWYKSCHACNLNGEYLRGSTTLYGRGVIWNAFRALYYSLKFVELSIRPKLF
ncbi:fibrinogen C domain-containing protein 1-like [Musca domestica]|uniref:Fibrinogen C domain-containing protein 1-like n=1 Tax=Musca domestica TaxID=7370 RepID=A0ABM3UT41_MUSDO|nr:fibrinogen C domain-containing protein 1-like [Musca domestica]